MRVHKDSANACNTVHTHYAHSCIVPIIKDRTESDHVCKCFWISRHCSCLLCFVVCFLYHTVNFLCYISTYCISVAEFSYGCFFSFFFFLLFIVLKVILQGAEWQSVDFEGSDMHGHFHFPLTGFSHTGRKSSFFFTLLSVTATMGFLYRADSKFSIFSFNSTAPIFYWYSVLPHSTWKLL